MARVSNKQTGVSRKYEMNERWRQKISASNLVNRLYEHSQAPIDQPVMSDSQIRAATILLNKVAPDLKSVDLQGDVSHSIAFTTNVVGTDD